MPAAKKETKKKAVTNEVVTREYTVNIHKRIHGMYVWRSDIVSYPILGKDAPMLLSIFSTIDNRLCINRLIIDNQNFNTMTQSGDHHTPRRHNMVWLAQAAVHSAWKDKRRRRCWRRRGGKIKQCVPTIYCSSLTDRPADHHCCLDHLGGLTCISISWRHAAWCKASPRKLQVVVSCLVRLPYSCYMLITWRDNRQTTNVWACIKFTEIRLAAKRQR